VPSAPDLKQAQVPVKNIADRPAGVADGQAEQEDGDAAHRDVQRPEQVQADVGVLRDQAGTPADVLLWLSCAYQ